MHHTTKRILYGVLLLLCCTLMATASVFWVIKTGWDKSSLFFITAFPFGLWIAYKEIRDNYRRWVNIDKIIEKDNALWYDVDKIDDLKIYPLVPELLRNTEELDFYDDLYYIEFRLPYANTIEFFKKKNVKHFNEVYIGHKKSGYLFEKHEAVNGFIFERNDDWISEIWWVGDYAICKDPDVDFSLEKILEIMKTFNPTTPIVLLNEQTLEYKKINC